MKNYFCLFIILIVPVCFVSCHGNQEYLEESCTIIYRINSIRASSDGHTIEIFPELITDKSVDVESRHFYNEIDTNLVFKGWVKYRGAYRAHMESDWSLIDWRITGIEVKAIEDFDEKHPAGSSLNDVMELCYSYKKSFMIVPLSDFKYGRMMLTDYYPGFDATGNEVLMRLGNDDTRRLPPCDITLTNYFGQSFNIISKDFRTN